MMFPAILLGRVPRNSVPSICTAGASIGGFHTTVLCSIAIPSSEPPPRRGVAPVFHACVMADRSVRSRPPARAENGHAVALRVVRVIVRDHVVVVAPVYVVHPAVHARSEEHTSE